MPSDRSPPTGHAAWPDIARGACMLLVVLLHTERALAHVGQSDGVLHLLNQLLVPLRQPMFFLVSGLLGAGVLGRGAAPVLRDRVGRYLYLYVLWWGLAVLFHTWLLAGRGPSGMEDFFLQPAGLPELLTAGQQGEWFFYALAVFFGLSLVLARLPAPLHAAVALAVAVPGMLEAGTAIAVPAIDWLWYFPFFTFATRPPALVWRLAGWFGRWRVVVPALLLWSAASAVALRVDPLLGNAATALLALFALPPGLGLAGLAAGGLAGPARPLIRAVMLVGRNTLPIYVLHPLVLRLLFLTAERPDAVPKAAWILGIAALAAGLSLAAGQALGRCPGLFGLPPHALPAGRPRRLRAGDPLP